MRMHPRRFGTYSLAARFSSALVNEMHKGKKNSNNSGCLIFVSFGIISITGVIIAIYKLLI